MADVVLKRHCKLLSFFTIIFAVFLSDLACHILTKLHPNGSTDGKVMTSYRFFQRATIELEIYPRSCDNYPTPFDLNFSFLSLVPPVVNLHAKFEVSSSNVPEIRRGSQNFKSRSRDPFPTPFDPIFHYYRVNLHAKFEVSSSNRSRDTEGVPKFQK